MKRIEKLLWIRLCKLEKLVSTIITNNTSGIPTLTEDPIDFTLEDTPTVWINSTEEVIKFWTGTEVCELDKVEGANTSVFGTDLGDI